MSKCLASVFFSEQASERERVSASHHGDERFESCVRTVADVAVSDGESRRFLHRQVFRRTASLFNLFFGFRSCCSVGAAGSDSFVVNAILFETTEGMAKDIL